MNKPAILYFGNDWHADNRTSSHHIARGLAKHFQVYYIDCPGLRAPRSSGRDLKRIGSKFLRFFKGVRQTEPNIKVRTLLQVPFHRFSWARWVNHRFVLGTLKWMMWREGIESPIVWCTVPHLSLVLGNLRERLRVYYCVDDYSSLPDVHKESIRAMDERLTRGSDLVFVTSETLLPLKKAMNPNVHVSRHGVDVEHFSKAQDPLTQVPAVIAGLKPPLICFVGLVEDWVDLDLIVEMAHRKPDWNFLIIGRVAIPIERVPQVPNIRFVGKQRYEDLPAFGKACVATIIPFKLTELVYHINPLKLREYLAMGKPVVSTELPEIESYGDVIEIARTREEFLPKLEKVISYPRPAAEYIKRVAAESWDARVTWIMELVEETLSRKGSVGAEAVKRLSSAKRSSR